MNPNPGPNFPAGHGWTRLTTDDQIGRGATVLYGVYVRVSVTGSTITLYDGNSTAGRLVMVIEGEADITMGLTFPGGLHLEHGLYVDLGTNVDEALILWDAAPSQGEASLP